MFDLESCAQALGVVKMAAACAWLSLQCHWGDGLGFSEIAE